MAFDIAEQRQQQPDQQPASASAAADATELLNNDAEVPNGHVPESVPITEPPASFDVVNQLVTHLLQTLVWNSVLHEADGIHACTGAV